MFRRLVEAITALMLLLSLYLIFHSLSYLAVQDYVAAILLGAVGLGLLRSGVELARTSMSE